MQALFSPPLCKHDRTFGGRVDWVEQSVTKSRPPKSRPRLKRRKEGTVVWIEIGERPKNKLGARILSLSVMGIVGYIQCDLAIRTHLAVTILTP